MYRLQPIQDEMIKRVGFRQTSDPRLPQLVAQITESDSGIFIQDRHPLLNTNNLKAASENFDQWPYEEWVAPVSPGYAKDVYFKHEDKIWVSNVDDNEAEPGEAPLENWTEVNNFSQYLLRQLLSSAQRTVEKMFQYKTMDRNTKTIFENIHLFDGSGNRNSTVLKQGRFVGFLVRLQKQKHLTILLRKLGTQFNNVATNLKIYVYHESQQAPILTRTITHSTPNSFQWNNIEDIILPYVGDHDAGGVFYIGYYEDDLGTGVQAITRNDYKWNEEPCAVCGNAAVDAESFRKWSAYSSWTPIAVPAAHINAGPGRNKFSNTAVGLNYSSNFGLNFHLTLKCDLTDFILENIDQLDEAYANQIAYELLNQMAYSLRDNGDAKQLRDKAGFEMVRTDSMGIAQLLDKSFKALDFSMSGFNTVCLPDSKRKGARTGSMI